MTQPIVGSVPLKISRQERYCLARLNGMVASAAHRHAGYTGSNSGQTERMPAVVSRLKWLQAQAADRVIESNAVTRVEVIEEFRSILRLAKEGATITDKDGNPTGAYKPDLSSANKANEGLAKMHGFMVDVTRAESFDEELEGKDPKELETLLLSLLEQVDPNMRKKLLSEVEEPEAPVIDMETIGSGETLQ